MTSYRSKDNPVSLRMLTLLSIVAGLLCLWLIYLYPHAPAFGILIGVLLLSLIFGPCLWEKKYAKMIEVSKKLWHVVCWDGKEFHFSEKDIKELQVKANSIRSLAVLRTHQGYVIRFTSAMEGFSDILAILGFHNQQNSQMPIRSLWIYLGFCWALALATGIWSFVLNNEFSGKLYIVAILFFLMGIFILWGIFLNKKNSTRSISTNDRS